jgi:hypothetical protein
MDYEENLFESTVFLLPESIELANFKSGERLEEPSGAVGYQGDNVKYLSSSSRLWCVADRQDTAGHVV